MDAQLKIRLLTLVKAEMGLEPSPKQDMSSKPEVVFAGLTWTVAGITVGKEGVKHILSVLDKEPGGVTQARTFRGVLVQARSAFKFTVEEMIEFGRLLAPITAAIDEASKTKKWVWSAECKASTVAFRAKLQDQPRAYTNPDDVLSDGKACLMILGDADPSAIVTSLWVVFKSNANEVVVEDLMEEGAAILLNLHPKSLNTSQRRWHISEKELYAMVHGVRKFGQFIASVIGRWAVTADKEEWSWNRGQLTVVTPKVVLGSDSSSALGMLLTLMTPGGKIEYITPKLARMMGYADDCACTLYWPMARLQLPGGGEGPCNSLCDFLCRLVGQLQRMLGTATEEDPEEAEELPYDDNMIVVLVLDDAQDDIPAGLKLRSLALDDTQWQEVHRAYDADVASKYAAIQIKDIYDVFNNTFAGSLEVKQKIQAWEGKVFFPIQRAGKYVIFTLASAVRAIDDVLQEEEELVLVVPRGALVTVSRCLMPTAEDQEGMEDWEAQDMRTDILWWAHNGKCPHARRVQTLDRAMGVAWWPEIEAKADHHATTCTICVPKMDPAVEVGFGQGAIRAFYVVQMDDKIITQDIVAASGGKIKTVAILAFTCVCTGVTVFCLRKDMTSLSAGVAYYTEWFKRFGGSVILWSDNAAAYMAAMMDTVATLCGTKRRVNSALGSHSVFGERRMAVLSRVLYEASVQGQLRDDQDLQLVVAGAEMEVNHFTITDGSTPMQRAGLIPMSSKEHIAPTEWQLEIGNMTAAEVLARIKDVDELRVAQAIRERCETLLGIHRVQQDKRARYNYARRVAEEGRKDTFNFATENDGIVVGDVVDWNGSMWTYLDFEGPQGGTAVKVLLEKLKAPEQGVKKWVLWEQIRPVAIGRDQLQLPRAETECRVHDTVAYDWDGGVHVGVVLSLDKEDHTVLIQVLEGRKCAADVTFLAVWSGQGVERRMQACPEGYTAEVRTIESGAVHGVVELKGNHKLTEDSRLFLEALGVEAFHNGK